MNYEDILMSESLLHHNISQKFVKISNFDFLLFLNIFYKGIFPPFAEKLCAGSGLKPTGTLVWSIWNIKYWLWTSKFDAGRQFDGFWRPTSIFDVLSQIFDVQHQFLTSYIKFGVNIWLIGWLAPTTVL